METILRVELDDDKTLAITVGEPNDDRGLATVCQVSKDFQDALLKELRSNLENQHNPHASMVDKVAHKEDVEYAIQAIETSREL